jgi:hypothetical protein
MSNERNVNLPTDLVVDESLLLTSRHGHSEFLPTIRSRPVTYNQSTFSWGLYMTDGTFEIIGQWNSDFDDEWKLSGKITLKDRQLVKEDSRFTWKLIKAPRDREALQRWWGKEGKTANEFITGTIAGNVLKAQTNNLDDSTFIRWNYYTLTFDFKNNQFTGSSNSMPHKLGSDEVADSGTMRGAITSVNGVHISFDE